MFSADFVLHGKVATLHFEPLYSDFQPVLVIQRRCVRVSVCAAQD